MKVAPDNNNLVAICDTIALTIYVSVDGGASWSTLGRIGVTWNNPATAIKDIDISAAGPHNVLAVAGTTAAGAEVWC